jgi:integrase
MFKAVLIQQQRDAADILKLFASSIKSKVTARTYMMYLKKYTVDLVSLSEITQRDAEDKLIGFIITKREEGANYGTLHNAVAAISKFHLVVGDIELNKNRINRFLPEYVKAKKDRGYKQEEIETMLTLANERTSAIILLLASTGMRLGALPLLKMGDLEKREDIYKITLYPGAKEEYCTYCSPVAKQALDFYLQIRERHGEVITNKSPVIREQYNKINPIACKYARHASKASIRFILEEITERVGIRARVPNNDKNKDVPFSASLKDIKLANRFRKFFNTQLVNSRINPLIKELLMGHKVGLEVNYYKPTEEDIESEYMKAIDALTINPENRLKRKVEMLTIEKSKVDMALSEIHEMKAKLGLT